MKYQISIIDAASARLRPFALAFWSLVHGRPMVDALTHTAVGAARVLIELRTNRPRRYAKAEAWAARTGYAYGYARVVRAVRRAPEMIPFPPGTCGNARNGAPKIISSSPNICQNGIRGRGK